MPNKAETGTFPVLATLWAWIETNAQKVSERWSQSVFTQCVNAKIY